jgi:hypothetical protein
MHCIFGCGEQEGGGSVNHFISRTENCNNVGVCYCLVYSLLQKHCDLLMYPNVVRCSPLIMMCVMQKSLLMGHSMIKQQFLFAFVERRR